MRKIQARHLKSRKVFPDLPKQARIERLRAKLARLRRANADLEREVAKATRRARSLRRSRELEKGIAHFLFPRPKPRYSSLKNPLEAKLAEAEAQIQKSFAQRLETHARRIRKLVARRGSVARGIGVESGVLSQLLRVNNPNSQRMRARVREFLESRAALIRSDLGIQRALLALRRERGPKVESGQG